MGLLSSLLGNASEVDLKSMEKVVSEILIEGESVEKAFSVFKNKWMFTNKRLLIITAFVGTPKTEYMSIPYRSIVRYEIESAGMFDSDCELKIWLSGSSFPIEQEFSRGTNIKEVQRLLSSYVLK